MNGRHSVASAADARAHASDPRFNAPPTISRLHGDARTRVLAGRAEAYRRSHLATYEQPAEPARQRDEHWLESLALVLALILMVGGLWFMVPA